MARSVVADWPRQRGRLDQRRSRTDFEAMNRAIEMHRLSPVIDQTFPFAGAKEAYRHFEVGVISGKW
jgi:NADPH:quinone reductase-like Zn-dependent oxidoreductase